MFGLTSKYVESAKAYHPIKTSKNPEFRHYMDLRNSIYGYLKFYKFGVSLVGFGTNKLIMRNIIRLLWNKDVYDPCYKVNKKRNLLLKVWYKISPEAKITNKTRLYVTFLILKAFIWNFRRLRKTFKEHNVLTTFFDPHNSMYSC